MDSGGRQRVRVVGGTRASAPGADHPVQPSYTHSDSEQTWNRDVKTPSMASPTALKTTFYPGSSTGNRPEPESAKSSHRTATPNYLQPTAGHMPEPPAPRSWTPSKLSAANSPARMSPRQALEQEMSELAYTEPACVVTATTAASFSHASPSKQVISGVNSSPGSFGSPGTFRKGYYNTAFEESDFITSGRPSSPGQPFAAQHNNLMGNTGTPAGNTGSRPGSSGSTSSTGGVGRLRERLGAVGGSGSTMTAIQAFTEPEENSVVATATSSSNSGRHASPATRGPKATRLVNGHASSSSRTAAQWHSDFASLQSATGRLAALQLPGPSNGVIQCYVKRIPGLLGMAPSFELRVEASDELLAVARKRKKSASSSYLISMGSSTDVKRGDEQLVAKLKANVVGTEYLLRVKGGDINIHKGYNAQLLAVNFKPTVNHVKAGPRTLTAAVPVPETQAWAGVTSQDNQYSQLTTCLEAARARELPMSYERDLVMLHTMKPHYDPVKQVHYLDFKQRVTKMSLKNFQLVHWDHNTNQLGNDLVMMFGKKGHDEYAMDFCYPLNTLQAFALALSSIDTKLCYAV